MGLVVPSASSIHRHDACCLLGGRGQAPPVLLYLQGKFSEWIVAETKPWCSILTLQNIKLKQGSVVSTLSVLFSARLRAPQPEGSVVQKNHDGSAFMVVASIEQDLVEE